MRWRLRLEKYDYEIEYKKGKENTVAEALFRLGNSNYYCVIEANADCSMS